MKRPTIQFIFLILINSEESIAGQGGCNSIMSVVAVLSFLRKQVITPCSTGILSTLYTLLTNISEIAERCLKNCGESEEKLSSLHKRINRAQFLQQEQGKVSSLLLKSFSTHVSLYARK